ncbi:hypothetical protein DFR50_10192 [Roseiarcus fermentans]|uniref:Uncharacterized protein n=1 Tax=Roseiarcus fermentans TaxID=1473586 RepID=A0A366FU49_9HYPH|nr:hypothetical protein [Roseiarcus fermentans]RBP18148.1 hypothetical protein DFR50_10192 [Roseiarcus fermentans]
MYDNERIQAVRRLLFEYVESPSLRHLRDSRSIDKLAQSIIIAIDRQRSVWSKWEGEREALLRAAAECWIPIEDMRQFLNNLPGPKLTTTDVAQRLRAVHEEPYNHYPNEGLQEACLGVYRREVSEGTELPAIIGALQEFVEEEGARRRREAEATYREQQKEERETLERRFLAGADCKWTPIGGSKALYIRKNGRAYRLVPTKDKRWELFRIQDVDDSGKEIGVYGRRGDANKALAKLAYEPEPRW